MSHRVRAYGFQSAVQFYSETYFPEIGQPTGFRPLRQDIQGLAAVFNPALRASHRKEELFLELVHRTVRLAPKNKFRFNHPLYSIDATTIALCLSVFDRAKFRKQKGAVKLHCQLNHNGHIPDFAHISDGKMHTDVVRTKQLVARRIQLRHIS